MDCEAELVGISSSGRVMERILLSVSLTDTIVELPSAPAEYPITTPLSVTYVTLSV